MTGKGRSAVTAFAAVMAAVFIAGFFLLVIFGAESYRNTVRGQSRNMTARSLGSYILTVAKSYDWGGDAEVRTGGEYGPVLVISDGESGYGIHIFKKDGKLYEDYSGTNEDPVVERAQVIGETELFEAEIIDGLLEVRTDAGRTLIRLRSGGVGQ